VSNRIQRPVFYENQILGAADLSAAVEHGRGQDARHNRYMHLWGIAVGLELTAEDKNENGEKIKKITLSAGVAIDGNGREIVVPQSEPLSENTFAQGQLTAGIDLTQTWFPVFLTGRDETARQQTFAAGACDSSLPTRVAEGYEVTFDRPGQERELDRQTPSQVADGPGKGGWRILLGFVKWKGDPVNNFIDLTVEVGGIGRRYAGVQADEVAARGGALQLRTRTTPQDHKPALVLNENEDGRLQFGSLNAQGKLQWVFQVTAKGDVEAKGKIAGAVTPGSVQLQSGVVMDGCLLPLPPGITPEDAVSGKFTIHSHVTPRITPDQAPTTTDTWGATPVDCSVSANRLVSCQIRWFKIGGAVTDFEDRPGLCDYSVFVSVPAATGGGS
jgi:hypothetical protein